MASVYRFLPGSLEFYEVLQARSDLAESRRHERFLAVLFLQRMARGYLIRKHVKWLAHNALTIQCAFRMHLARIAYRAALKRAVRMKHARHYAIAARRIQALWRGHYSRRTKFCYRSFRRWLAIVKERGDRKAAEAAEFGVRSRADDLRILEEEARQWLAFVVFKLHHLLRTISCPGVYSDRDTTELSEFEKLLKAINYTEYMKRLRKKYTEFVKKHRPLFSNKRLFPVIGDGADYWYLSLPEMYELTMPYEKKECKRHIGSYHGKMHPKPFFWRRVRPSTVADDRGPFTPKSSQSSPKTPPSSPAGLMAMSTAGGDSLNKDPRFHLYVKHYKPDPNLMEYVDFHVNALLTRRNSIENGSIAD